mmetsp:Transcript_29196/g.96915  ORF Transcript_29196/g.96915 Transcript_29196/m.96915 type:complete len:244 (-) Transcript_29196:93-824(-)
MGDEKVIRLDNFGCMCFVASGKSWTVWLLSQAWLCYLCFTAAVVAGWLPKGERPNPDVPKERWVVMDDEVIRTFGPVVPFILLFVRALSLGTLRRKALLESKIPHTAVIFFWVTVLRFVTYIAIRDYHKYFSDHIYLCWSIVALLAMEMKHCELGSDGCGNRLVLLTAWVFMAAVLVESYVTARYYHTRLATATGFIAGALLFGSIATVWRGFLEKSNREGGSFNRPLVGDCERQGYENMPRA